MNTPVVVLQSLSFSGNSPCRDHGIPYAEKLYGPRLDASSDQWYYFG